MITSKTAEVGSTVLATSGITMSPFLLLVGAVLVAAVFLGIGWLLWGQSSD